jgi:hypothetical protein
VIGNFVSTSRSIWENYSNVILEVGHNHALISHRVAGVEYCNTGMKFRGT